MELVGSANCSSDRGGQVCFEHALPIKIIYFDFCFMDFLSMHRLSKLLVFSFLFVFPPTSLIAQEAQPQCVSSPVSVHGALRVKGSKIVDKNDNVVSFAGNGFSWTNTYWGHEEFYNAEIVSWLQKDWGSTIVRPAMGVDEVNGYLDRPEENLNRLTTVVDAAIANNMYVIIDWHSYNAELYRPQAIAFFQQMARKYGENPHVIYEIYNEPVHVSWSDTVKPYAEAVISAIREIDPDNMIIVGTPTWSQDVDVASLDPIQGFDNIAYTLHFYAGTHGESLRQKAQTAIDNGLPLFVTEWGSVEASADGEVNHLETDRWMDFLQANDISHCNYSVTDKDEGAAVVEPGSNPRGSWSAGDLTMSGMKAKEIISTWHQCSNSTQADSRTSAYPDGVAHAIPGVINPTHYDTGGFDVSYFDTSVGNSGNGERQDEDVDTAGGVIGWIDAGEWVEFTVDVKTAGTYSISYEVASMFSGQFHLEFDGQNVTGAVNVEATGGWSSFNTITSSAELKSGQQKMRIAMDRGPFNIADINFQLEKDNSASPESGAVAEADVFEEDAPLEAPEEILAEEPELVVEEVVEETVELPVLEEIAQEPDDQAVADYTPISANFSHDGEGKFRWEVSGTILQVNSYNIGSLTINGVDFTNRFAGSRSRKSKSGSTGLPEPIDGKYYIEYEGLYRWSHVEITGSDD